MKQPNLQTVAMRGLEHADVTKAELARLRAVETKMPYYEAIKAAAWKALERYCRVGDTKLSSIQYIKEIDKDTDAFITLRAALKDVSQKAADKAGKE